MGVRVVQCKGLGFPVVGQQDDAEHVVHRSLGIVIATFGVAAVDDMCPLRLGQRIPAAVLRVAAVAYFVVAPVGFAGLVIQVVGGVTVGVVVFVRAAGAPRLVAVCTVVVAARAPAEEVAVNC